MGLGIAEELYLKHCTKRLSDRADVPYGHKVVEEIRN